jgi:hypothetical protein
MNKYAFNWSITPQPPVEYSGVVPPFDVAVRGSTLTVTTSSANRIDEQNLREQADQVAHNLARSLSYEHAERFEVAYGGCEVETPTGRNVVRGITVGASLSMSASCDFEVRDTAGNVIDSSALRRERERQAAQQRITDLTRRAPSDPNLRDMLDHWSRYAADPDGRLHPLYDVLQVAERLYGGRMKAAGSLNIDEKDLNDLGRISNDPAVLNSRHPGESQGPHRVATESEVSTCKRVARSIIDNYASKIVL